MEIKDLFNGFMTYVWDHWEAVVTECENGEAFSENVETNYKRTVNDNSLQTSLSKIRRLCRLKKRVRKAAN